MGTRHAATFTAQQRAGIRDSSSVGGGTGDNAAERVWQAAHPMAARSKMFQAAQCDPSSERRWVLLASLMQGKQGDQRHWAGLRVGHEGGCRPTTPGPSTVKHQATPAHPQVPVRPPWASLVCPGLRHPLPAPMVAWPRGTSDQPAGRVGLPTDRSIHCPLTAFSRWVVGGGHSSGRAPPNVRGVCESGGLPGALPLAAWREPTGAGARPGVVVGFRRSRRLESPR